MRILQVGKFYPIRGGVEKVMYDLTLGLSEMGVHCDMLCASTEDHPEIDIQLNPQASVFVIKTSLKLASTMLAPGMISRLRRIAPAYDIIHIHHPDPMAALALYLSGYKGKVVLHWHSDILKQQKLLKIYKPLQNWVLRRVDRIVGTSPVYVQQSDFLVDYKHKLGYLPIGVLPVQAKSELVNSIKDSYRDRKLIFALGRLVEYKGFEYLIQAARFLDDSYKIVIAGKGPLEGDLSALIKQYGLEQKVELAGFLSDELAHAYFQASDAFVLSSVSKNEAFGIVQIEAMSCGTPVITADIPGSGVSWVNQHMQSGLVCKARDANDLAQSILKLTAGDQGFYNDISRGAKERFDRCFHRDVMVEKTIALYRKMLEE